MADNRLVKISSEYLAPCGLGAFAVPVARVLSRLSEYKNAVSVESPEDVEPAFHSGQRISPALLNLESRLPGDWEAARKRAFMICYSTALFPHRVNAKVEENERGRRFNEFWRRYERWDKTDLMRLAPEVPDKLLEDLSAVGNVDPQERKERIEAAALYLAARETVTIRKMRQNWEDERAFLHFFRECLWTPPSCLALQSEDWPDWDAVKQQIQGKFPAEVDHWKAVTLEQILWSAKPTDLPLDQFLDLAKIFWEEKHGDLISGFSYYDFTAHFFAWWKQCVNNLKQELIRLVILGRQRGAEPLREEPGESRDYTDLPLVLTTDLLRLLRQCYRFIRAAASDEGAMRLSALDSLWEWWVLKTFDPKRKRKTVSQIAREHGVSADWANTWVFRYKLHVKAFILAKVFRWGDRNIQAGLGQYASLVKTWLPPLARAVPKEHHSLWALMTQALWHQRLYPDDSWHWEIVDFTLELSEWMATSDFAVNANAVTDFSPADEFAAGLLRKWNPKDPCGDEKRLVAEIETFVGEAAIRCYRQWGETAAQTELARDARQWIPSVWYLLFVERVNEEDTVMERLVVDEEERETVRKVVRAMKSSIRTGEARQEL